jgi:hypothetical protein
LVIRSLKSCEKLPASFGLSATQAGGLRHINHLPVSWGRSPTCPGILSHLLSKVLASPVTRWVFDNWQVSGITMFASGMPSGIGLALSDGADLTGGGDGQRVVVTGKAPLPHGERTF